MNNDILKIFTYFSMFLAMQISLLPIFKKNINSTLSCIINVIMSIVTILVCTFFIKDISNLFNININLFFSFSIFTISILTIYTYGFFNNKIQTTTYNIKTEKNLNIKIIFISDLHIGNLGINENKLTKIINIINAEKPDLLLFGGDIIEYNKIFKKKSNYTKIIQKINVEKIYGILGNHEYYFHNNPFELANDIEREYHIKILKDECVKINDNLVIAGRHDNVSKRFGIKRKSLDEIINNININNNFTLLIDHNPADFNESINNNIDLQLSGHTHAGQFFPFNFIIKLFYEKAYGIFKKNNSILIVSSGVGTSGIPVKVMTKREVVIININK